MTLFSRRLLVVVVLGFYDVMGFYSVEMQGEGKGE